MNEFEILELLNDCTDCVYALSANYGPEGRRWDVIDVFKYRRGCYDESVLATASTPMASLLNAKQLLADSGKLFEQAEEFE